MIPQRAKQAMCPEFQKLLIGFATELDTQTKPTIEQLRDRYRSQVLSFNEPLDSNVSMRDISITGRAGNAIALRLFTHSDGTLNSPTCFFIHGGGWVLGDLDTHAGICVDIAKLTGGNVIAVDYRLSPESIYPDALHDCIDALQEVVNKADALGIANDHISLIGDSAGGNLCASVALACRGSDINIASQVLIYPGLGYENNLPSFDENADIPGLSRDDMTYYFQSYIGGSSLPDELAAPLLATDFSDLPPCYISVAEFDPLRDDGIEYAHKLSAANTQVVLSIEKGLGHSWLWVRNRSSAAKQALQGACDFLSEQPGSGVT